MTIQLTTGNHDRDIAGLKYVYPVISRRAEGLSIGINFNPNNACNWRCVYCQVPNLISGNAPDMDFALLSAELTHFLAYVCSGEFFNHFDVDVTQRVIKDIAISGNGEPTSLKDFAQAIQLVVDIASQFQLFPASKLVVISNGSLLHKPGVQQGLAALAKHNGELWFKLDSATEQGRKLLNNTGQSQQKLLENLRIACQLCPTKLQTCMLHYADLAWTDSEKRTYLHLLKTLQASDIGIQQIMLYSLARPSLQPEAVLLQRLDNQEMQAFATEIRDLGYQVSVSL